MKRAMVVCVVLAAGLLGCGKEETHKGTDPRYDGLLPPKATADKTIFDPIAKPAVVGTPASIPAATTAPAAGTTEPAPGTETPPPETPADAPPPS